MPGTQIIGYEGVDKHVDVLATAIHARLKYSPVEKIWIWHMRHLILLPRISKHGWIYDRYNIARTLKQWHLEDMDKISKDKDVVLIDVRTVCEFSRAY